MPCGGIGPCTPQNFRCFHCGKKKPLPDHFVMEWDSYLHRDCVAPFLQTDEGKIVLEHKHAVFIYGD